MSDSAIYETGMSATSWFLVSCSVRHRTRGRLFGKFESDRLNGQNSRPVVSDQALHPIQFGDQVGGDQDRRASLCKSVKAITAAATAYPTGSLKVNAKASSVTTQPH